MPSRKARNPKIVEVIKKWLRGVGLRVAQKWLENDSTWLKKSVWIRTRRIGANPEKSGLVNFGGPN